jgi:hypothetical protein
VELAGALAVAFESGSDGSGRSAALELSKRTQARLTSMVKSNYRKIYMLTVLIGFFAAVFILVIVKGLTPILPDTKDISQE